MRAPIRYRIWRERHETRVLSRRNLSRLPITCNVDGIQVGKFKNGREIKGTK